MMLFDSLCNVVPRLSRMVCTSLSTLIIWGTIALALPLHQVNQNHASISVNSCFDFPAHCKKLKETLIENKKKPIFQVFRDITQTHQLLLKKIHTHSKPSFPHIKQQIGNVFSLLPMHTQDTVPMDGLSSLKPLEQLPLISEQIISLYLDLPSCFQDSLKLYMSFQTVQPEPD